MVSAPADTPVTIPPEIVALLLDMVHEPPDTVSERVVDAPWQTLSAPLNAPAAGIAMTVTDIVAVSAPQEFTTIYKILSVPDVIPVT